LRPIGGTLPDPLHLPTGCAFHPRCPLATQECSQSEPPLVPLPSPDSLQVDARASACFHADLVEAP
jgi:oligopeptide/dipeptide ABC transporter ATP-binding protein